MRARWPLLATVLSIGVAYVAYPYLTLYRLGWAIHSADAATLEALVDWPAVREGIKEDVCDLVADDPAPQTKGALPPFGASFMRGIRSSAIDQAVTPQALLAATTTPVAHSQPAPLVTLTDTMFSDWGNVMGFVDNETLTCVDVEFCPFARVSESGLANCRVCA